MKLQTKSKYSSWNLPQCKQLPPSRSFSYNTDIKDSFMMTFLSHFQSDAVHLQQLLGNPPVLHYTQSSQHKVACNPSSSSLSSASFKSQILAVLWETQMWGDFHSSMQWKITVLEHSFNFLSQYTVELLRSESHFITCHANLLNIYHTYGEIRKTHLATSMLLKKKAIETPTVQHHELSPLCYSTSTTTEVVENWKLIYNLHLSTASAKHN